MVDQANVVQEGNEEAARDLLSDASIDVDGPDSDGNSPLHWAVGTGSGSPR
jgi:ankyrin repeat protein